LFARVVRRGYAAANRRDWEVLVMGLDPGIEFHPRQDLLAPGQAAVFYGHAGYRELWRIWLDAFEDLQLEPEEVLDLGDTFLVMTRLKAHGSGSGVPMDQPFVQLFKLQRGLVVWQRDFRDRSEALEAAGLSE
jgi:ketosteroid isomerase-like protein